MGFVMFSLEKNPKDIKWCNDNCLISINSTQIYYSLYSAILLDVTEYNQMLNQKLSLVTPGG